MNKIIDLNKPVADLVKENPELIDVLSEMGFTELKNKMMLASVGKVMTLTRGAAVKKLDINEIKKSLTDKGYIIKEYDIAPDAKKRVDSLKNYIHRLNSGEALDSVREDFKSEFKDVNASEIMHAEQEMMLEGMPIREVQKLCDVHSALFHGTLDNKLENNLKNSEIIGHPVRAFHLENMAILEILAKTKLLISEKRASEIDIDLLREIPVHYAKKGDLLYPLLKVKYNQNGPSDVMWGVDDEIRDEFKALKYIEVRDDKWLDRLSAAVNRAEEMVFKEENILLPLCENHFTEEEWIEIYIESKEYKNELAAMEEFPVAENRNKKAPSFNEEYIVLPSGKFTPYELDAMLNTMPYELTFVDRHDINSYFNDNDEEKLFKRPMMALGRDVYSCHPAKIEPMVRSIINDFKAGKKDEVKVWMTKKDEPCLVLYMAVRDSDKNYLGTLEIVQHMGFARDYFSKNK